MVTKQLTKETGTGGKIRVTTEELVKQICKEQGISVAKLAAALGQSRQNFYKKLQRDTLTAQDGRRQRRYSEWNLIRALCFRTEPGWEFPKEGETHGTATDGKHILPGKAEETVKQFEDPKLQEIAWGELYFFMAQQNPAFRVWKNTIPGISA